ncbi:DUF2076 domain-containing protein [Hansschlegelia quercus]|uniref:DUF2076 domain-containing protein n=1 Tax=Hansschlegelia quercus TaxID=2528245 RepID=A0A4Q9GLH7_9HYPH|nr:DUF2076 domain-containing protein [Hansschlegelia quercus]TBN55092.1 DUF2076 domain-containing protein [Hansschlegelia quercus]
MTPAERNLIAGLFDRLRSAEGAYRDPEAESFIQEQVSRQPHAPYAMAQTLIVQNQALEAAKARIDELERQVSDARGGSFSRPASETASPWGPRASEAMGAPAGFGGRPGYERAPDYGTPPSQTYEPQQTSRFGGGGGFLSGALQTAAGVAGGALLFSGIQSMFGGGTHAAENAGEAAKLADTPDSADDAASPASEEGGWFSGLLGGVDEKPDATPVSDDDGGNFGGDDGGDWT